jgi:hypothetical protein
VALLPQGYERRGPPDKGIATILTGFGIGDSLFKGPSPAHTHLQTRRFPNVTAAFAPCMRRRLVEIEAKSGQVHPVGSASAARQKGIDIAAPAFVADPATATLPFPVEPEAERPMRPNAIKCTLLVTTALALTLGKASADDRVLVLRQDGIDNAAEISQPGARNALGSVALTSPAEGVAATARHVATQEGDGNALTVTQSGDDNRLGADPERDGASQFGQGVDQMGDDNAMTLTQSARGGNAWTLQQQGDGNGLVLTQRGVRDQRRALRETNLLTGAVQRGDGNRLTITQERGSVAQGSGGVNRIGASEDGASGLLQIGDGNVASALQNGPGGNVLTLLSQRGDDNVAEARQLGQANAIDAIDQQGNDNRASVAQDGSRNGTGAFTLGFASAAGATSGAMVQTGTGNVASYAATGDDNRFGITQQGDLNAVGTYNGASGTFSDGIVVAGIGNETAVFQDSTGQARGNVLELGPIRGNDADIGIRQIGRNLAQITLAAGVDRNAVQVVQQGGNRPSGKDTAGAAISVGGDDNRVALDQNGTNRATLTLSDGAGRNTLRVTQSGTNAGAGGVDLTVTGDANDLTVAQTATGDRMAASNGVTLAITGDGNALGVTQSGRENIVDVSITASNVNALELGPSEFIGAALDVSVGFGVTLGEVVQDGTGNRFEATILSDSTLFGAVQRGDANTIRATVRDGSFNEFAISQVGNGNLVDLTQIGSGNSAGITQ